MKKKKALMKRGISSGSVMHLKLHFSSLPLTKAETIRILLSPPNDMAHPANYPLLQRHLLVLHKRRAHIATYLVDSTML